MLAQAGPLTIRPLQETPADLQALARWLSDPRVLEFYEGRDQPFSLADVQEKYAPRVLTADGVQACLMVAAGQPVGYLQYERLAAEDLQEYGLPPDAITYGWICLSASRSCGGAAWAARWWRWPQTGSAARPAHSASPWTHMWITSAQSAAMPPAAFRRCGGCPPTSCTKAAGWTAG